MKEVVSAINIITTQSKQEIIRQNKNQIRFLDKLVLEKKIDQKLMMTAITCSMLESPSTSNYDEMDNGISKSIVLEPTTNTQ